MGKLQFRSPIHFLKILRSLIKVVETKEKPDKFSQDITPMLICRDYRNQIFALLIHFALRMVS